MIDNAMSYVHMSKIVLLLRTSYIDTRCSFRTPGVRFEHQVFVSNIKCSFRTPSVRLRIFMHYYGTVKILAITRASRQAPVLRTAKSPGLKLEWPRVL